MVYTCPLKRKKRLSANSKWVSLYLFLLVSFLPVQSHASVSTEGQQLVASPAREADRLSIDKPHNVEELEFGEVLFDYYRRHDFSAITKLLVAKEKDLLHRHADEANLLLGALYIDYGLLGDAEKIFKTTLKETTDPAIKNAVWMKLATLYYQLGRDNAAREILEERITEAKRHTNHQHTWLLANLMIRNKEYEAASKLLDSIRDRHALSAFSTYNLASAYNTLDRDEKAASLYKSLIDTPAQTRTNRALQEKAIIALGAWHMEQNEWEAAIALLGRVRQKSPYAGRALLDLGWSHLHTDARTVALSYWEQLMQNPMYDTANQEAFLHVSKLYELEGAFDEARLGYRKAVTRYNGILADLSQARKQVNQEDWNSQIIANVSRLTDPMAPLPPFSPNLTVSSRYLYEYYATNEFNLTIEAYQELARLKNLQAQWREQLPVLEGLLKASEAKMETMTEQVNQSLAKAHEERAEKNSTIAGKRQFLKTIKRRDDNEMTATVEEGVWQDKLEKIQSHLDHMQPDDLQGEDKRYQVLQGLLQWRLSEKAPARRWQFEKSLIATEQALSRLDHQIAQLEQARAQIQGRYAGIKSRIDQNGDRLASLSGRLDVALVQTQTKVRHLSLAALRAKENHLKRLYNLAWLEIAKLNDKAYVESERRGLIGEPAKRAIEQEEEFIPLDLQSPHS